MADLFWPGDERAADTFAQGSVLEAMVEVELAWLRALQATGLAPEVDDRDLVGLVTRSDVREIAEAAEASGNPVVPLVSLLRERLAPRNGDAATWLHRGLTSQDVLDTALVLSARSTVAAVLDSLEQSATALGRLARGHRDDVMAGRTLTQHAVPITFGLKAAQWLQGVLDARDDLRGLRFPVQVGGAAGTLAAAVELTGDADAALFLAAETARFLGLDQAAPWHTTRTPLTRYADALVRATDAMGHVANDVLLLARPEIGEVSEPSAGGRGGSSTMPQKANPVLSVLIRRAALVSPGLAAQLHLAAAASVDERPDGSWHTEWAALAALSRHAVTAASQTAELLEGLHVDTARMAATVKQHASALTAEQRSMADLVGQEPREDPRHYLGAAGEIIDAMLSRTTDDDEEGL